MHFKHFIYYLLLPLFVCQAQFSFAQKIISAENKALYFQKKGKRALKKNQLAKAERYLEQSLKIMPANKAIKNLLTETYIKRGKVVKAVNYMERFFVDPRDTMHGPETCYHLGLLLINYAIDQNNDSNPAVERAISMFEKAISLNSQRHPIRFPLQAECYAALGIARILCTSLAFNPLLPKNERQHCKILLSDMRYAENAFNEALRFNPKHEAAAKNYEEILKGLDSLKITPLALDHEPYSVPKFVLKGDSIPVKTISPIDTILKKSSINPLIPLYRAIVDTLNQYDEVVLVVDISGSMIAQMFPGKPNNRMDFMKNLIRTVLENVDSKVKFGAVSVGGECYDKPTLDISIRENFKRKEQKTFREDLLELVPTLQPTGRTPLHKILLHTPNYFSDKLPKGDRKKRCICLLSDGLNTCPGNEYICDIAQYLFGLGIKTNVVSLLLEDAKQNEIEYEAYRCMAELSGGVLFSNKKDGSFKTEVEVKEIKPCEIVLPPFYVDRCSAAKNLLRLNCKDIQRNGKAVRKNVTTLQEVQAIPLPSSK